MKAPMNTSIPCLGLIVPPAGDQVPDDAVQLYGGRVRFLARSLGIGAVSPDGFAPVIAHVTHRRASCAIKARRRSR